MTNRVVFDMNALVSAVLGPGGTPNLAIKAALASDWEIARSHHIVSKLGRSRFRDRVSNADLNAFLRGYQAFAESFTPDPSVRMVAPDEEDDLVLGTAVAAQADFLVTGDKGMLAIGEYRGVRIVSPRDFLALIDIVPDQT